MKNPWTKKNPFMSLWLSSANKAIGASRGQVTASVKREAAATQADIQKQVVQFWTGGVAKPRAAKKRRR